MNTIRITALCLTAVILFGMTILYAAFGFEREAQAAVISDKYALVYNGPGSAEDCPEAAAEIVKSAGLNVKFVSAVNELPRLLKNTAVFIIGGTEDDMRPILKAFTPQVSKALRSYVQKGGRYLGICGGGFMASTGWDEGGTRVKGLALIPASSSVFNDDFSARILPIKWMGKIRPMFFKAGPDFQLNNSRETVQIIASYDDGSIAALICSYGKGRVAVCGPHPEARESWKDEAVDGSTWTSSTDLAVALLKDLLSNRPLKR